MVTLLDSQGMMGTNLEIEIVEYVIDHEHPSNLQDLLVSQDVLAVDIRIVIRSRQAVIRSRS